MKKNQDCSTPRLLKPLNDVNSSFRQNSQSKYEQQKYQQLINHISVRFPSIKEKVSHYIYLLNLFDDIRIDTLINQFIKILQSCMKNFDQQHKRITELEEEFEKYKEEKEGKLKEYSKIIVEKDLTKQKKLQVQEKNMFVLKHVQLQKTIDILSSNLKNVQEKDQILKPLLKKQIQDQTSIIQDQQILQTESEQVIEDLKQQLIFAKRQDKMQIGIIKELQLQVQIYEEQVNQLQNTITDLKQQKSKYYELFYMCNEDYHSYKIQIFQKLNKIKLFEGIIKVLQNRIDKLTIKRSKQIEPPFQSKMDYEESQLALITRPLESECSFHKYILSTTMDENNQMQQINEEIYDISKIRFNYPPFSNFLDKSTIDILSYQMESQQMSINFMGTLRAIMDGMYQEIQKEYSISFQSYVYSWLSTFYLENHEIQVIPPDQKQSIQEFINRFYLQLMIPNFDKVWEIIQFRHFLNEVYTNEELCFYLHVRYILKGVWIEQFDFMHELINYIKIEKAEQVIALVLSKLNKTNINMIFKSLRQSSIQVNKNLLVQTGYVLQMMIEIYRVDRNQRYKQLLQLFPLPPVGFKKFFDFVQANYQLSSGQIAELYRETHLISQGQVNVNSFFVVSQKLLIDQIKGLNFLDKDFNQSDLISELKLIHGDNYLLLEELMKKTYQEQLIKSKDLISYIQHYQLEKNKDRLILLFNQIIIEEVEQFKLQKMSKISQNQAIIKVQRYFKQKFLKNYLTLYSIINLKLKQLLPAE